MSRWPVVALGEVLAKHEHWIAPEPDADYRQVTMRLWGKGATLRGVVKGAALPGRQNRVRAGQFVMSRIDARHGAFGLVPPDLDGAVVTSDFPAFDVRADRLDPGFLAWASRSSQFVDLCRAASEGSTNRVRLKEDRFAAQRLALPPLAEQRRIAARLDAVAERLASRSRALAAVETELNATLRAAFGRIAADAPRRPMGEVAPLVRRPVAIELETEYTEIGIKSFYKGIFHRRTMRGAEYSWQKLFYLRRGDLVFSNLMAWEKAIGVAGESDEGCVGNHRMLTCEPHPTRCEPVFLDFFFKTPEGFAEIVAASPGSIARNKTLSPSLLSGIPVPVPSLDAQRWFDTVQDKAATIRARHAAGSSDLDTLLPALLAEAFA